MPKQPPIFMTRRDIETHYGLDTETVKQVTSEINPSGLFNTEPLYASNKVVAKLKEADLL